MSAVPVAIGVVGGLALVWLVKAIFTTVAAVMTLVEKLVTFPTAPARDR